MLGHIALRVLSQRKGKMEYNRFNLKIDGEKLIFYIIGNIQQQSLMDRGNSKSQNIGFVWKKKKNIRLDIFYWTPINEDRLRVQFTIKRTKSDGSPVGYAIVSDLILLEPHHSMKDIVDIVEKRFQDAIDDFSKSNCIYCGGKLRRLN